MTSRVLKQLLVIAALAVAVVAVGLVDHHLKATRMHRADVAWWYCVNRQVGCGLNPEQLEHRADRIERGWQQRERGYILICGVLIGAALMAVLTASTRPAVLRPSRS